MRSSVTAVFCKKISRLIGADESATLDSFHKLSKLLREFLGDTLAVFTLVFETVNAGTS